MKPSSSALKASNACKKKGIPSTENKKNRINEAANVAKRTIGYKRRKLSTEKGTSAMLTLLKAAKKAAIPAKYVLFDSWFSSPSTLHVVKDDEIIRIYGKRWQTLFILF